MGERGGMGSTSRILNLGCPKRTGGANKVLFFSEFFDEYKVTNSIYFKQIFCEIINVFTVSFVQFNVSLLNKSINFLNYIPQTFRCVWVVDWSWRLRYWTHPAVSSFLLSYCCCLVWSACHTSHGTAEHHWLSCCQQPPPIPPPHQSSLLGCYCCYCLHLSLRHQCHCHFLFLGLHRYFLCRPSRTRSLPLPPPSPLHPHPPNDTERQWHCWKHQITGAQSKLWGEKEQSIK